MSDTEEILDEILMGKIDDLERRINAMQSLITTGQVYREGVRIQQAILDAGIAWQLGLGDDSDCVHWFLADGVLDERWSAQIVIQMEWEGEMTGRTVAPFSWTLDRRYAHGERPEDPRDRVCRTGSADTIQEASERVFEAIRDLEAQEEASPGGPTIRPGDLLCDWDNGGLVCWVQCFTAPGRVKAIPVAPYDRDGEDPLFRIFTVERLRPAGPWRRHDGSEGTVWETT